MCARSARALILLVAFLTSVAGRSVSGQADAAAIPCLLDWSSGFDSPQTTHFAADLVAACADARTIQWDEKIADADRWLGVFGADSAAGADPTDVVAEWRKVLNMLNREKQHLADEMKLRAGNPGRALVP